MTTYVLRAGSEARLDAGPLVATVRAEGRTPAHRWQARGRTSEPPTIVRPDRIVLPTITEPTSLRILPVGADRFAPQTVVSLSVGHDRGGADGDRVLMDEIDLSGLTHRDLVELIPDGQRITVAGLGTVADTRLPPVAETARDAAREILGVPQVPDGSATELTVLIDTSASMRPALADGSLVAACNLLAGLGVVVAPGRRIRARAGGLTADTITDSPPERLADDVAAGLQQPVLSTGFRSTEADRSGWTVLLTSGVPADRLADSPTGVLILGSGEPSPSEPPAGRAGADGITRMSRTVLLADPPARGPIAVAVGSLLAGSPLRRSGARP